ncbi:MAG: MBL fold metallo-hydrolase, partial [Acidimicrobiales bacterium]
MQITFHGVRGSTPAPTQTSHRYGGNTSCVLVMCEGAAPILFDLGTGVRTIGADWDHPLDATALVTHLHWDHVQGFPFCAGVLREGSRVTIYGPKQADGSFSDSLLSCLRPPFFPVELHELPCDTAVEEVRDTRIDLGPVEVLVRSVPHVGETNGYRVTSNGSSVAYVPDHQQPA